MMDYKLLEAMAKVVEAGGFDKAARILHVTQSAVSQRVKLLEELTGQVLLARSTPPEPTPAGRRILKHYHQVKRLEGDLLNIISPSAGNSYESLAVGINADSLAMWFMDAVRPFLQKELVTLDLRVDDQDETHKFLRDGDVAGCISSHAAPVQGCCMIPLGSMNYRMLATPGFRSRWFSGGMDLDAASRAPIAVFNRKDELQNRFFMEVFGSLPVAPPIHYIPSSEQFLEIVRSGLACGMVPDLQSSRLLEGEELVELMPSVHMDVSLYWHAWNLNSGLLDRFSRALSAQAEKILNPPGK